MLKKMFILCTAIGAACVITGCQADRRDAGIREGGPGIMAEAELQGNIQKQENAGEERPSRFQDEGFREAVRMALDLDEGASEEELLELMAGTESLNLSYDPLTSIESLADLRYMPELKYLDISFYSERTSLPTDLAGIEEAAGLEMLSVQNHEIKELSFAGMLPKLKELYLVSCDITDIIGLERAVGLERLSLYGNHITDLTPLGALENLVELSLNHNEAEVTHYEALSLLTKMQDLGLSDCGLENLAFVNNMPQLYALNVNSNRISDLSPLRGHSMLERLGFRSNMVGDISVLGELTKLNDLAMDDNHIADISVLSQLKELSSLGISDNPITDISALKSLDKLFMLNLGKIPVKDITPLIHIPFPDFYTVGRPLAEQEMSWKGPAADWINENQPDMQAYILEDGCAGDLDRDGISDVVFVYSELFPKEDEEDEEEGRPAGESAVEESAAAGRNDTSLDREPLMVDGEDVWRSYYYSEQREIVILLGRKDGSFRQLENDIILMAYMDGGMRGDPFRGIIMADGYLAVQEAWGSRSGTTETSFYRYRKGTMELVQENSVSNDNFSNGYIAELVRHPSGKEETYIYALDERYNYVPVCVTGLEQLNGVPQIGLGIGYHYYKEPIKTELTAVEAIDRVKEELGSVWKELKLSGPVPAGLSRADIGYPSLLKQNMELLKGVALPDYYYRYGESKENTVTLYYNQYGLREERPVHEIIIKYWDRDSEYHQEKSIYVDDEDGTFYYD